MATGTSNLCINNLYNLLLKLAGKIPAAKRATTNQGSAGSADDASSSLLTEWPSCDEVWSTCALARFEEHAMTAARITRPACMQIITRKGAALAAAFAKAMFEPKSTTVFATEAVTSNAVTPKEYPLI